MSRSALRKSSWQRWQRWLMASTLCALLVLAGCSVVRTLYNQAGNIIYWQLNRAFYLNDEQEEQVRHGLYAFFRWHRQNELPVYAQLLNRAAREAQGPISPELACERRLEFEKVGLRSVDHLIPVLAELTRSLKPEQLKQFQAFMAKRNENFREDYLQDDKAERDEAFGDFALKWAEFFYGRLGRVQRERFLGGVLNGPFLAQDLSDEIQRGQREFLAIARRAQAEHLNQAQVEQALRALIEESVHPATEPRKSKMARWISYGCGFASVTHSGTNQEQRDKVTDRMLSWERDVLILSRQ
jgi:hypothetical protein